MNSRFAFFILVAVCLAAGSAVAGTIDDNKVLVSNFIAAENSQDFEKLPTFLSQDYQRHSEATPNVVG